MISLFASIGIGTEALRHYAVVLASIAFVLIAVRVLRRRLPAGVRTSLRVLAVLLLVRLILFDNPLALRFYRRHVTPELVGSRQYAVLNYDIERYARNVNTPLLANLAVGSSQVGAIFSHWVSDPPQPLRIYSFAGMKTLDYVLNKEEIAAQNPARVILYLSAFDMTAGPELYSLSLAPSHPLAMWDVIDRVRTLGPPPADRDGPIHEYIAAQLFPEYRYAFLFKAMVKPWFTPATWRAASARPSRPARALAASTGPTPRVVLANWTNAAAAAQVTDAEAQHIREFVGYYSPEWLDYNYAFLKDFVAFCQKRGILVAIVEGQVSPLVKSEKVDALNAMVRSRMTELVVQYANVTFVLASETYQFTAEDYHDLTHVDRPAAMKYTSNLSAYLAPDAMPTVNGACGLTFLSGWFGRENSGADWLRWSDGTGALRVTAREAGDFVFEADVLSMVRPNVVDTLVEGKLVNSLRVDDPAWAFHRIPPVRLHLDAGETTTLVLRGQAPAVRQANDPRPLAIAVKNPAVRRAAGGELCELTADSTARRKSPF